MAPRFDTDSLKLDIAVADLVDADLRRNLGFAQRGGYERMWLGQAIHRGYQEEVLAADPTYRAEIPITVGLDHRGWQITIRGRIDGLRKSDDEGLIVEEIKSVRRGDLPPSVREIYERQALLYSWMLDRNQESVSGAELVLIAIGGRDVQRHTLEIDLQKIDRAVRKRLNSLLADFERRQDERRERERAGEHLSFPYTKVRPGQDRIIERVTQALERREHLLLEAPTGIGKTAAALFPALRHALQNDKRIFVLTAKTLQQDMATTVLEMLNPSSTFSSLRLRAKSKMCANGEVICHEEFCPFAKDYFLKLHQSGLVEKLLGEAGTLTPEVIFNAAQHTEVCPFEVSLELTERAQAIVCDYNYVFDPYVALHRFGGDEDLDDVILIIDEVHNLVDRGRGYYSPELGSSQMRATAEALGRGRQPQKEELSELCRDLERLITRIVADVLSEAGPEARAAETVLPEEDFWSLRVDFDEAFVDYLEYQKETSTFDADDPFVDLYFSFLRFLDGLTLATTDDFSQYVEYENDESRVKILCKDPSRFVGRVLNRTHSAIALSGTLSPPEFYRELLGFDNERTGVERVPTPFPHENRCIVVDSSVSTLYREREQNYLPIAESISAFSEAVPGNCLALFPSYSFLRRVAEQVNPDGKHVLAQRPDDSDARRQELLEALRSPLTGDVLLLAVAGGVFSEGVDYPGEMLRAVAVIGPCLPAVSLERQLLKNYYQDRFEKGFEYAFVVPGMTRVVQAAGRLIRSADDTGVLALIDRRFLQTPYRFHLPESWLDGENPEQYVGEPSKAAAAFFATLEGV
jgi:DNA excision repair protein ERCC-2